jgi:hypothetical protein
MTTEGQIVDSIWGCEHGWPPFVRNKLRSIARQMLDDGIAPLKVSVYMSEIIEAVWGE